MANWKKKSNMCLTQSNAVALEEVMGARNEGEEQHSSRPLGIASDL